MSINKIQNDLDPRKEMTFELYEQALELDFFAYEDLSLKGNFIKVSDIFQIDEGVPEKLDFLHIQLIDYKIKTYKDSKCVFFDPVKALELMKVRKYLEKGRIFKQIHLYSQNNSENGTAIYSLVDF